jgi:hypothetical protein
MSMGQTALLGRPPDWRSELHKRSKAVGALLLVAAIAASQPVLAHLKDHVYTIIGLGLFDAAMFVHSLFTGLLVTGISFIVFELKVSAP